MLLAASNRRTVLAITAACVLVLFILGRHQTAYGTEGFDERGRSWKHRLCNVLMPDSSKVQDIQAESVKHSRVAIASTFGFHHDVYLALAWTMERVMKEIGGRLQVYAPTPLNYAFQNIVDDLRLYSGEIKHQDDLLKDVTRNNGDGGIDMIVLGTCEFDLKGEWHTQLLAAWDARDSAHKFQIVCIVHHVLDKGWQGHITEWARRDAIRLLPISAHVAKEFRTSFNELADSFDPTIRTAGYEHIPIDVHVPVLDIPRLPERSTERILSKAVIQGSFNQDRRDYANLFQDLSSSLAKDPSAWGYLPLGDGTAYSVNTTSKAPFHLFLIGSGHIEVPSELKDVVSVHVGLDYNQFYEMMGEMDICIPAFAENGYYEHQASSTFAMAVECEVPILVTKRMRESYTYADDDRVVVTRPAAMREIAAIKALRSKNAVEFLDSDASHTGHPVSENSHISYLVDEMLSRGWTRTKSEYRSYKEDLWKDNEVVVQRLLRDL
ncbi:hypothetical protein HGRIS_003966 [Hohenbuehelia grisea]|uniref:Glycosyltransferase n=1 Tax=Hohenbuehelia grisea TaxID=104357 RepID=A0ABR3JI01_9AGAR